MAEPPSDSDMANTIDMVRSTECHDHNGMVADTLSR